MPPPLTLRLLGPFDCQDRHGAPVRIQARKNRALLAILALSPGLTMSRERLAGLLWGDRQEEQARSSLRQSLALLRKDLGETADAVLATRDETVGLRAEGVTIDAVELLRLDKSGDPESVRRAAEFCRGELLADHGSRDESLESWLSLERARLKQTVIGIFERLVQVESGERSAGAARRLVELDPLREASHRRLMESLAAQGDRSLALRQYEELKTLLQLELGVEPDPETQALAARIARAESKPLETPAPEVATALPNLQARPVIVVLPFTNMSGDPEQDYFADGISEDIITDLARYSGLRVVARGSAFSYKGRATDVTEIARHFAASAVLEGSVRKSGRRVRINVQLSSGKDGTQTWADRLERELDDILSLQSEIAAHIVGSLETQLLAGDRTSPRMQTVNAAAYDAYLKGRQFFHVGTKASLLVARRMFQKSVETAPQYAPGFSSLALCIARTRSWHAIDVDLGDIIAASARALELDPSLAEAHTAMGVAMAMQQDGDAANRRFELALQCNPDSYDANFFYGWHSFSASNFEKAEQLYRKASDLLPDDFRSLIYLWSTLRILGKGKEAEECGRLGLERAERAFRAHPDSPDAAQLGACVLAEMGDKERAMSWLEHSLAVDPDGKLSLYNAACVYALLDEPGPAMDLLEKWLVHADDHARRWFLHDPDLVSLRTHDQYRRLAEMVRKHPEQTDP